MKKILILIAVIACGVAAEYVQTSPTGAAPWTPKRRVDSARVATIADSAKHAPPSAFADSSRRSGLADSAKRAGWAPLDSGRVRGIVGDTATALRTYVGSASTTGNASTATKLATPRTISATGDGTWSTFFDGSANATGTLTLASLLTAGSAGGATSVPTLTWDAKGRLTAVGSAAISIPHTQINDWAINTTPAAIGALPSLLQSGAVDFNSINSNLSGAYTIFGTTSYSHAPSGLGANGGGGMLWQGCGANYIDWGAQVFVDAQQDILWYRTQGAPATWRAWHQLLTGNQNISLTGAVTGSGTTSIVTTFANVHLAGINQELTTTSSPTFGTVYGNVSGTGTSTFYGVTIAGGGSLTVNGTSTFNRASTFYQKLTAQNISAWSIVPTTTAVYDLGSSSLVWHNVYASAMYEAGVSLSAKYAPIAVPSYFSTNAARTLSSQSGSVYVYTVSQTTTQTLQDGTVSGETITVKNAQNSSTLVLTGNINAGSSTITSLSTAVLVWNGSTWY